MVSKGLKDWRAKQKRGAIMQPAKFKAGVAKIMKRSGLSKEAATKIMGNQYWKEAKSKFAASKKK